MYFKMASTLAKIYSKIGEKNHSDALKKALIQFEHKGENSDCGTKPRKLYHRQDISRTKNVKI